MKQRKLILVFKKNLFFLLLAVTIGFLISCNNEESEQKEDVANDTSKITATSLNGTTIAAFNGNFPVLALSKTDLDDYFDPPPHKNLRKLVFRFRFENENALPSLVVYGAKSMSIFQPPATPLTVMNPTPVTIPITGEFFLGNLELSSNHYNKLKNTAGANPDLIFTAKISNNYPNQVTYSLGWGTRPLALSDSTTFKMLPPPPPTDELNPSPPAPPGN